MVWTTNLMIGRPPIHPILHPSQIDYANGHFIWTMECLVFLRPHWEMQIDVKKFTAQTSITNLHKHLLDSFISLSLLQRWGFHSSTFHDAGSWGAAAQGMMITLSSYWLVNTHSIYALWQYTVTDINLFFDILLHWLKHPFIVLKLMYAYIIAKHTMLTEALLSQGYL